MCTEIAAKNIKQKTAYIDPHVPRLDAPRVRTRWLVRWEGVDEARCVGHRIRRKFVSYNCLQREGIAVNRLFICIDCTEHSTNRFNHIESKRSSQEKRCERYSLLYLRVEKVVASTSYVLCCTFIHL